VTGLPGYDFKLHIWGPTYWENPRAYPRMGHGGANLKEDRFEHTFTVPDNMWVFKSHRHVEWFREEGRTWKWGVMGSHGIKPQTLNLGSEHGEQYRDTLLFSPTPFLVVEPTVYDDDHQPQGAYLQRARRIHNGELGEYVPCELPLVAREASDRDNEWTSKRDRKRGHIGWVRLTEAADLLQLTVERFLLGHWLFVDASDRRGFVTEFKDVRIDMIAASSRDQIHRQKVADSMRCDFTRAGIEEMLADARTDWSQYWVRRGFARTALLLHHYGWNAACEQNLLAIR
jgi:hypothetical protein